MNGKRIVLVMAWWSFLGVDAFASEAALLDTAALCLLADGAAACVALPTAVFTPALTTPKRFESKKRKATSLPDKLLPRGAGKIVVCDITENGPDLTALASDQTTQSRDHSCALKKNVVFLSPNKKTTVLGCVDCSEAELAASILTFFYRAKSYLRIQQRKVFMQLSKYFLVATSDESRQCIVLQVVGDLSEIPAIPHRIGVFKCSGALPVAQYIEHSTSSNKEKIKAFLGVLYTHLAHYLFEVVKRLNVLGSSFDANLVG